MPGGSDGGAARIGPRMAAAAGFPPNRPRKAEPVPSCRRIAGFDRRRPGGSHQRRALTIRALRSLFEELGGEIRTNVEVTRITVERGRAVGVEFGRGACLADMVVSNADVGHTYRDLLPGSARRHWSARRLDRLRYSMSCFVLYLGVRRKYPQLKHHTLIVSEHYRDLLSNIFDDKTLPKDFSLWMHMPTATDASMAPQGCESLHVIVPVPNSESGIDWAKNGPGFADRVLDRIEMWGLQGLREHLEVMHTFAPGDFAVELKATRGNAFALEPRLTQTGWFRPHSRSEDVRDLYLVGAGTHPGAGIPGVLLSAEATYDCIAADHGLPSAPDRDKPAAARTGGIAPERPSRSRPRQ